MGKRLTISRQMDWGVSGEDERRWTQQAVTADEENSMMRKIDEIRHIELSEAVHHCSLLMSEIRRLGCHARCRVNLAMPWYSVKTGEVALIISTGKMKLRVEWKPPLQWFNAVLAPGEITQSGDNWPRKTGTWSLKRGARKAVEGWWRAVDGRYKGDRRVVEGG